LFAVTIKKPHKYRFQTVSRIHSSHNYSSIPSEAEARRRRHPRQRVAAGGDSLASRFNKGGYKYINNNLPAGFSL
jgi:hypothetical protein